MLNQTQIRDKIDMIERDLESYNDIFKLGYKVALQDVLEIKRAKAIPSQKN